MKKILIAGGTGFIGNYLHRFLTLRGFAVFVLTRHKSQDFHIAWHPEKKEIDLSALEGFQVYINLVGESIAKGAWTKKAQKAFVGFSCGKHGFFAGLHRKIAKTARGFYFSERNRVLRGRQTPALR